MVTALDRLDAALAATGRVVYAMERRGVCVDRDVCADIRDKAGADAVESRRWLDGYLGAHTGRLPWRSNWLYSEWLKDAVHGDRPGGLGIQKSPYKSKGKVKPGETCLDSRAIEYLAAVVPEHRAFLNRVRTYRRQLRVAAYAENWLELAVPHPDGTWRLHPAFGMAFDSDNRPGARTGRFGVKNPPLQQVPRDKRKDPYRLRRAFVAPPGKRLLVMDYGQLEVVILAHLSAVLFGKGLLAARLEPGQPDLHSATARYVFGEVLGERGILDVPVGDIKAHPVYGRFRDLIKAIRYGLNYGKGEWGFGNTLFEVDANGEIAGPPLGEDRARGMIQALLAFDPEIKEFQDWARAYITKHHGMPSLAGRWIPLPDAGSEDEWKRNRAWRQACNFPMQAGGQEITAKAMVDLDAAGFDLVLQVHDELHAWVDEDRADLECHNMKTIAESAWPLRAYLKAEPKHGASWEGCK